MNAATKTTLYKVMKLFFQILLARKKHILIDYSIKRLFRPQKSNNSLSLIDSKNVSPKAPLRRLMTELLFCLL